jgi:hypothetical protein
MPDRLAQHSTTQTLRRVGFGLLIAAVVVELALGVLASAEALG